VRSGVLTSVHAFAVDPRRGIFILAILVILIGGALALYAWRAPQLKQGQLFAPISREGTLVLNNVLLAAAACELHPRAVLTGIEMKSVKDKLREATDQAIARGVTGVPSIAVADQVFWGDDRVEEAAEAIR